MSTRSSTYLDCDTTPPIRSRYFPRKRIEPVLQKAFAMLGEVTEGQIGIYANCIGEGFRGYAIKYAGQEPYFEAAGQPS